MIARAGLLLALVAAGSALAGCTDQGVVGEVLPLSTPPAKCSSDMECGEGKRCEDHACVACEDGDDDCERPAETDSRCGQPDAACPECAKNGDCTSDALPFCVEQTCVACREDDDCASHKCEHGVCEADDDNVEHQDDGAAGGSDDNSGAGSMSDGEAGSGDSDDGP